ncbi:MULTISPECIES: DUF2933 domain-containing protein [unclassified Mesorhizobium]|uniref:DUF2933 domain-containing protein n=1 Tax=unclassified Mesorhizobium TaxID=325217 RepID=UPI0026B33B6C
MLISEIADLADGYELYAEALAASSGWLIIERSVPMSVHHREDHQNEPQGTFLASRTGLVLLGFLAIGGFLLFTEHRAHLLGALFWLLPFACAFLHMFMHGGHGGHGSHREPSDRSPS